MRTGVRRHRRSTRGGARVRMHARLMLRDTADRALLGDGDVVCIDIGLGGLRAVAADAPAVGTALTLELRLPTGRVFRCRGRVVWSRTTCHPELLATPRGKHDDACFGIAFDAVSTQDLLPVARLLVAREDERCRARRLRRLHALPLPA